MRSFWEEIRYFWSDRFYAAVVSLAAVCSYGFKISHETIGIDDTCIPLYFEEGLAPAVGRWTLYLINKLFHISDFAPWMTELAGVLLLLFAATAWCVAFSRILGREKHMIVCYTFFAALFLSCPLISEIYVYYLHNGVSLAYGLTAIALLLLLKVMERGTEKKKRLLGTVVAAAVLTAALGCYESFMIVFAVGMLLLFILIRGFGNREQRYCASPWAWVGLLAATVISAILFRWLVLKLVLGICHIEIPEDFRVEYRGVFSFVDMNITDVFMVFKRQWLKYYLNAFAYRPITILVLGILVLLTVCVAIGIRKKDIFLPLAALAVPVLPICMVIVEGKDTYYRAAQYVPLIGAFAVFLLLRLVKEHLPGACMAVGMAFAFILLWDQCAEMNRWFYVDHMKYQDARGVMEQIAYDLEKDHDAEKPVIFRGAYYVPYGIVKDAYLEYGSVNYGWIRRLGDMVDPHLVEKYNGESGYGYGFAETPINSALRWGVTAFDGTGVQLGNFMEMLGHRFEIETDLLKIEEAQKLAEEMPGFPETGYIREYEEYIIVNF
ncbi:MAG: glucosyltransferase domain-containing protein [Lachnospiraceae bacterium]|nr:glucosyltransferase domain-containing protein [Butyrivibrio sp.]MCM1342954.1 glucosyltransferase domain-containing protein [Muribaculaceae bacterium]MCM1411596.1 glucosyltransferase domain-containing protein [Lachnospiraceae bacterium]